MEFPLGSTKALTAFTSTNAHTLICMRVNKASVSMYVCKLQQSANVLQLVNYVIGWFLES